MDELISDNIPELNLNLVSVPVGEKAKSEYFFGLLTEIYEPRKLKATWTPELAQDLEYCHSIDAQAELIALLQYEIKKQIKK